MPTTPQLRLTLLLLVLFPAVVSACIAASFTLAPPSIAASSNVVGAAAVASAAVAVTAGSRKRKRSVPRPEPDDVTDTCAITPVQQVAVENGTIFVKREDKFVCNGARGAKARSVKILADDALKQSRGVVAAGSREGSGMLSRVARVAQHVGVSCLLCTQKGTNGDQEPDAIAHDATIDKRTKGGKANAIYLKHSESRAEEIAQREKCVLVKLGAYSESVQSVIEQIKCQFRRLSEAVMTQIERIVVSVGTGVTLVGIVMGLEEYYKANPHAARIRVVGVHAEEGNRDPTGFINQMIPNDMIGEIELIARGGNFKTPKRDNEWRNIPLDPYYEAKATDILRANDLFWVVGNNSVPSD